MKAGRKFVAFAASFALIAAPLASAASAGTKKHHRHHTKRQAGCPLRRTAEGELVDCQGWRLRSNATGWDNTCFNLDYLPSQFACSSRLGR